MSGMTRIERTLAEPPLYSGEPHMRAGNKMTSCCVGASGWPGCRHRIIDLTILMNLAWLFYGYEAILVWVALPIAIFLLFWWMDRRKRK